MEYKLNKIVEDLKRKGYFKFNGTEVKRFNKKFSSFDGVSKNIFHEILHNEYKLTGDEITEYTLKIINKLSEFPKDKYNNYQEYMRAKKEPSFNYVLNRFLDTSYKENQKKKSKPVNLNKNPYNISGNELIQSLINNDVFKGAIGTSRYFFKYNLDNETFIVLNKDNFGKIMGIKNKISADYLFNRMMIQPTNNIVDINILPYKFMQGRKRDSIIIKNKDDAEYIINLINKFKVVS